MNPSNSLTTLPADLEAIFSKHETDSVALMGAFMPAICDHLHADRIFLQPRNPHSRICKIFRWRRNKDIPWPQIPGHAGHVSDEWFVEDKWEIQDPLWRAALQLKPSIYIEDLNKAASEGLLNMEFENSYMFHTAFIHGHAHWPPLGSKTDESAGSRNFYGSVQPAVFDGPRIWSSENRELMEKCLVRISPVMKAYGETAPNLEGFS